MDLFSHYLNSQVMYLFIISVVAMFMFSFLRMTLAGMFLYNMSSVLHGLVRNLMFFCGGYYLESNLSTFGLRENLDSLTEHVSPISLILQQTLFALLFQFIFFNVFIALTLMYLRKSRKKTKERMDILNENQDAVIEKEIKKDEERKRLEKQKNVL